MEQEAHGDATESFSGGMNGTTSSEKKKTYFVQRDYSQGLQVRFERLFPKELQGYVSEDDWVSTIDTVNAIFEEAEKVCCATVAETLLGCATCYLFRCFSYTRYEKKLFELSNYLDKRNTELFVPSGLLLRDPMQRGLRVMEVAFIRDEVEYAA